MNQETMETPLVKWLRGMNPDAAKPDVANRFQMEEHPWLARMAEAEEEDSLGEMLRYALDELRFA